MPTDGNTVSRRTLLKSTGVAGAAGLTGLAGCTGDGGGGGGDSGGGDSGGGDGGSEYPSLGNFPVEGDTVTYGFNVPQSGSYSAEGEDELRGYRLAVDHLNNGGGWVDTDQWSNLSGDGVLGYGVDFVEGDTATDPDTARQSASRMIDRDDAIMVTGGSSSAVAISVQSLCQQEKVQFMCAITHSNDTTGPECVRYSFREKMNAYMSGQALAPIVTEEYGDDLNFYQLYADYSWGVTQKDSMRQFFEEAGWSQIDEVATPLGTSDFSSYLSDVPDDADALFLNHYGLDAANSVPQAIDQGLNEDLEIIVPLYNRLMARAAGGSIEGIFGTADWNWQLDNEMTDVLVESYRNEYDRNPSYGARLGYHATMMYSAAAERAGTFYPPEVIRELEGHSYSNSGLGTEETMRQCDHQSMRPVPVVRGLPAADHEDGRFFEIVELTSRDDLGYGCDAGPSAECSLGEYGDE